MKFEDMEAYAKELANKAGLTPEQVTAWLEVFKNDKIREGFVTRSDYSRDLDAQRDKAIKETKDKTYEEARQYYQKWADTEVQPKLTKAVEAIDQLARYREAYGELTGGGDPHPKPTSGITKEDVEKMWNEKLVGWQAANVNMQKQSMRVAAQHLKEFQEVLDPDELEQFAQKNGYSEIGPAYEAYVKPRRDALAKERYEADLKKAREEGFKEGQSRSHARTAHEREYANPFLKPAKNDLNPRDEFFAGLDSNQ